MVSVYGSVAKNVDLLYFLKKNISSKKIALTMKTCPKEGLQSGV